MNSVYLLAFVFSALFPFSLPVLISALVVRIPPGKTKCFTEDVGPSAMSVATFRVAGDPPHHRNISARVMNPNGDITHTASDVEAGQFVFFATMPGPYSTCFWSPLFEPNGETEVDFEWKSGISAKGFQNVAKKEKLNVVEKDLKNLEDMINSIYMDMRFLREREKEALNINRETSASMGILSILSLAVCLSVVGMQIWHLKTFFERKKIL